MTKKKHNFTGFDDPIAIFKTGTHKDSKGNQITISDDDLSEMVSNFDAEHPFPFVIGHPKDDDPAYGWAGSLSHKNGTLYVDSCKDLCPEFVEGVENGRYRNRSVSIFKNDKNQWNVRHLGWLGANPPAVKGLSALQFNDNDAQVFEFAFSDDDARSMLSSLSWALGGVVDFMRTIKNKHIESVGAEQANKDIPEYQLESIKDVAKELTDLRDSKSEQKSVSNYSKNNKKEDNKMENENTFSQQDVDQAKKNAREQARKEFAHNQQCTDLTKKWISEGVLTPAMSAGLSDFMCALDNENTFEFAQGETQKTQTPFDFIKGFFENLPKNFAHLPTKTVTDKDAPDANSSANFTAPDGMAVDQDDVDLLEKAKEFMQKNEGVSFIEAVQHVSK